MQEHSVQLPSDVLDVHPADDVPWAAATYNVAMDTEIGHFDYCSKVDSTTGTCIGNEGIGKNSEPADGDDVGCWAPSASSLIKIGGCEGSNLGYDGTSYLSDWPNGSSNRPTDFIFTSPLTGAALRHQLLVGRVQHRPPGD